MNQTLRDRMMAKVYMGPDDCWTWIGANDGTDGYGRVVINRKQYAAHRVSYTEFVGEIPKGLHIDHLCRNRACINPAHLEPVTCAENIRRGETGSKNRTFCKRGHLLEGNTRNVGGGNRTCRICDSANARRRYAERKSKCLS